MNKNFFYDKNIITYLDLINYVNNVDLDLNLSETELFVLNLIKNLSGGNILNLDDLLLKIKSNNNNILLGTSGTTGKAKNVTHSIDSISKNIKIDKKYEDVCWGLTYPKGKMAFYQVLLQSLFNKSKLINLYGYSFDEITDRTINLNVSHLSGTPTFYRMLISSKIVFKNIKQITLGGELSTSELIEDLKKYFPSSKIKNIYASTETASIFASNTDVFKISEKYKDKIKFINNILYIHEDLLGDIGEKEINDSWYNTKDVVEFINDHEFKFVGRGNTFINVSGFKVNPMKVESVLNSLPYINNSLVYSKKNSVVGTILCCDVVLNENEYFYIPKSIVMDSNKIFK
jgi:acyl-coenzyme A synthetase/AMP-(fatty) acid ligase